MKNSKRPQIFCNQMQLFQDKKFRHLPQVKLVKVENHQPYHVQAENESSVEDIFQSMGNKDVVIETSSNKQKSSDDQPKNSEWKQYYNQRLKQLKLERTDSNHNQLTQIIAEEWKIVKKQMRKSTNSIEDDFLNVSKKQMKKMKTNSKFSQEHIFQKNDCESDIDFTYSESAKFIEDLRTRTFKLVINDLTYELPGKAIIEAVTNDSNLIYLNETIHNSNTKVQTPNEKIDRHFEEIGSDSELSICKGSDDIIIQNKIRSYL